MDLQHRGLRHRRAHETAGAATALDQARPGEFGKGLVHGHARAAIFLGQLVLEGDAMAGRPFARQDAFADVSENALVQRYRFLLPQGVHLVHRTIQNGGRARVTLQPAASSFITARKSSAMASRMKCLPPTTTFLARTQTPSTLAPLAKIQASRMPSPFLPARDGWSAPSETKSAEAPTAISA